MERNGRRLESGVADLNAHVTQYWHHLWKLKAPPKMHHLLWRCSMGYIPSKEALLRGGSLLKLGVLDVGKQWSRFCTQLGHVHSGAVIDGEGKFLL